MQIIEADRRGLASTGQPLQHLRREVGQPQLSADMAFRQSNGLGQFLNGNELTGLHAPPPILSRSPDQAPRTADHGPRTLALRPSDHGPRILRLGSWFLQLGPRLPPQILLYYNSYIGADMRFRKGNEIGSATRFGPEWAGARCGARTKAGTSCQRPAVKRTGRCTRHGGKSTGPRTEEDRARIAAAQTKHGRLTKEKRAEARQSAQVGREIRAELRSIEKELVAAGLLAKDWREMFESKPDK